MAEASIKQALDEIHSWYSEVGGDLVTEMKTTTEEITSTRQKLEDLQRTLTELEQRKIDLDAKVTEIDDERAQKGYNQVFDCLRKNRKELFERVETFDAHVENRFTNIVTNLKSSPQGENYADYVEFKKNVVPTLDQMPERFRKSVLDIQEKITSEIKNWVQEYTTNNPKVDGPKLHVELALAVDIQDEYPESVFCVVPVKPETLHRYQTNHCSTIEERIVYRVVQGLYVGLNKLGLSGIEILAGAYQDTVAIEFAMEHLREAVKGRGEEIKNELTKVINSTLKADSVLKETKLHVEVSPVPVDFLFSAEA